MKSNTQVIVQMGPYAGKEAIILGQDFEVLGHSIFGEKGELMTDYMKRLGMEPVSTLSKVFLAEIDGKKVALNNYEISGKE